MVDQWHTVMTSCGAIEGHVQAFDHSESMRVTLLDALHHRIVTCYLQSGDAERLRAMAGRRVIVEGDVTRHAVTGQPLAVRSIRRIVTLDDAAPDAYRAARGAAPLPAGLLPEDVIRALRHVDHSSSHSCS